MSNYTKTTNFAVKDTLPSGDTNKIVKGTEIDAEFNALAVASATKANKTNPSFTGEITIGSASVNETELEILDGATVTTTELNYVDGVTSSIQTQIDTKLNSSTVSAFGATLIDDADAPAARTTLGLGTAATTASTDYATAAQGTTADAALPKAGGAMTGAVTTTSTFDGRDVATDGTKLDGIEAGATADQTAAEIKTAYESNADTNAFTNADETKLDGIEASADVTDTTNVVASLTAGSNITIAADGTIASTASGGGDETLAQTLALGNTTGGTDISVSSGDNIVMAASSTVDGRDLSIDGIKLDSIEVSADVTDTTNVVASLTAGSNITIAADGTISSTGSGGGGETLQQTLAIGNTTTTDTKIQFRDTGLYINSSVDGQLDIVADTEIQIAATTVDVNGILDVSGNIVAGGNVSLPDNVKALFGTSSDFEIFHNGSDTVFKDSGTGILKYSSLNDAAAGTVFQIENTSTQALAGSYVEFKDGTGFTPVKIGGLGATFSVIVDGDEEFRIQDNKTNVYNELATASITISGAITEDAVTLTGTTTTIDLATATNFVHDLTGATTYTFSNPATTGNATAFTLKIIQDSTARAITWPASVDWAGGTAPTLTATNNGVDVFVFYTIDGGTTYYGFTAGQAMA